VAESESPRFESVVLVPALGAGQVVTDLRLRYDPSARAGVPPHVTLMFPFVPPPDLSDPIIDALQSVMGRAEAFDFTLTRVSQFEQGVVYLVPEPASPFVALTQQIGRAFGLLPFGGEFGEDPVAHLTVAVDPSASNREQVVEQVGGELPIALRAEEAWLMVGSHASGWDVVRRMRLGLAIMPS
jgi:2'-5' RNA ligase